VLVFCKCHVQSPNTGIMRGGDHILLRLIFVQIRYMPLDEFGIVLISTFSCDHFHFVAFDLLLTCLEKPYAMFIWEIFLASSCTQVLSFDLEKSVIP
jgi:hypothetical protein